MATGLSFSQQVQRFDGNENRVNTFVNGSEDESWTTTAGTVVPSIQKIVKDLTEEFYSEVSSGGASLISYQGSQTSQLKKTLEQRFLYASEVDFATEYLTPEEIQTIRQEYPTGAINTKPTVDITDRLIQAITNMGGNSDITSAYLYSPVVILKLPPGSMGIRLDALQRILITSNNVNIIGAGMFNTRLCHIGTGMPQEMFRFKNSYCSGLAHLTLDGGLPFNPNGTETYGVQIPLVLDQVAHFYSEGLNICNFRHRGIQASHLWESFLGNDLRIFNGGWFPVSGSDPGGIMFDNFRQESTVFPGSESNQVYVGKFAFSGNGSIVQFLSPCFNMRINQIVAEGRSYTNYFPPSLVTPKIVVSGLSSGVVIDQSWFYFHDQDAAQIGSGATLFDFRNCGPGCYFNNQVVRQEIPAAGRSLEVSTIINTTSAHPVNLNITVEDIGSTTTFFGTKAPGSLLLGNIYYRKDTTRTNISFLPASNNYVGQLVMSTGGFTTTPPLVYNYIGASTQVSP